jgi:hypothetical protein
MDGARPVVGLDVVQQQKDPGSAALRKGDRDIFDAVDGVIKAAVFWNGLDEQRGKGGKRHASIAIPLVVLASPFWDVRIKSGGTDTATERTAAYAAWLYPMASIAFRQPMPLPLLWLLCSIGSLLGVISALDSLVEEFHREALKL